MNKINNKSSSVSFLLQLRQKKPFAATEELNQGGSSLPDERRVSVADSLSVAESLGIGPAAAADVELPISDPLTTEEVSCDFDEQSHVEFLERMESLTMEDSVQYIFDLEQARTIKSEPKSRLESLPFDLQSHVFDYLAQSDSHSTLLTCKILSTHSPTQIIRCIQHKNVVFRHRLLTFTFLLRHFVGPERLVDELNSLHELSAGLGRLFMKLYEDNPVKYLQYRARIEREFTYTLEFRKLFAVFVNIVDILLGAFE